MANCANGTRHLAIELWRTEDSPGTHSTGSLAQTGPSEATPKGVSATTQGRTTTEKAPETSLTVRHDPPVTKTTPVKGKPSASAKPSQSTPSSSSSSSSSSSGWRVGDDIYKPTAKGVAPNWSTVRARYWKNYATSSDAAKNFKPEQIERMKRGLAPQQYNKDKGGMESMDLSHEPTPAREGGTNLVKRWPQDHAGVDPQRRPGY
jgi:filamentous hemagglutinin